MMAKSCGPYELKKLLGTSSFGAVYRAARHDNGSEVALRICALNGSLVARAFEELRLFADFNHPNIVPVLDYGVDEDKLYLAMPLVAGGTLSERLAPCLRGEKPLPSLGETAALLRQLADALDYIHAQGMAHHLIDPRNILFDEHGGVYLSDLGVSKLFKVAFSLRSTGSIASHKYSPPEVWLGEPATGASDQYSLAAIIYRMITGRDVFEGSSIAELMTKHLNETLTPPHYERPDCPAGVVVPLARALAKKPEQRYLTVTAFAEAFSEAIRGAEGDSTGFFPV
jgi:serine/threonine-protein kinase